MLAGSFSYINNNIYGIMINANLDLRIEYLGPGTATVYFTDHSLPFRTSPKVNPPNLFSIAETGGNILNPLMVNGIAHFVVAEVRNYTMTINNQQIAKLRVQCQQAVEINNTAVSHFVIP